MNLKPYIVYLFYILQKKLLRSPTKQELFAIFNHPGLINNELTNLKEILIGQTNSNKVSNFDLERIYQEIKVDFETLRSTEKTQFNNSKKKYLVDKSKLKNNINYNAYITILNYINDSFSNVEIDASRSSGASIKLLDGEPNTFLGYFSIDKFTNNLTFYYRTKQIKKLPFNNFEVNDRNLIKIYTVLDLILISEKTQKREITFKERIKKNDKFEEYVTNTKGLLSHQKAGSILADKYDRFAFFYDTGTGKTIMALEIMKNKFNSKDTKFLAIVPKPIIKTAWMEDSKKFFPNMKILPLSKNIKPLDYIKIYNQWNKIDQIDRLVPITEEMELGIEKIKSDTLDRIMKELKQRAEHYIINMELFRDKEDSEILLDELKVEGIILDESALIKNYNSKSAQRMRVISKKPFINNFYLLSGKPAPNNDSEYFSQMKIIDPDTFHMTRNDFIEEFFTVNKYGKPKPKASKSNQLAKMVANRSLVISKEDCLDLPPTTNIVNSVELNDDAFRKYASMYQQLVTEIETNLKSDKKIEVFSNLASVMKLRQIANGFILDENSIPHKIHDSKNKRLEELIDDIGSNQVIIWHNFDFELEMITDTLKRLGKTFVDANGKTKNVDQNIKDFKEGKVDVLIANLRTLKYGVTLNNAHYTIYYSLSYSYEDYYQSQARNYRYSQTEETTYFYILSENTIDFNIYNAVLNKESRSKFFEGLLKDAVKYGVDYKKIKDLLKKNEQKSI
jgi:SNF2 family DNA or RNA helicase